MKASCLVIVPLCSIIEDQINPHAFDLEVRGFSFSKDVSEDIKITDSR